MTPLDRPVWASLASHHEHFSEGGPRARRYRPEINLFAGAPDESEPSLAALAALVAPGRKIYLLQVPKIAAPAGLAVELEAAGVQMTAQAPFDFPESSEGVTTLVDDDAPEMLALATMTKPGPFLSRTHLMGAFKGVRIGGRLIAMAGERMRFPGYTEVSGVCVHPDFRSRGFARKLSKLVAADIAARGDIPFLHAWKTNVAAITLYEQLGFRLRAEVNVAILARPGA